jgi:acetylornithine deacetylase
VSVEPLDTLAFHRELVRRPSPSHEEAEIVSFVEAVLRDVPGSRVERIGDNVVAIAGHGPRLLYCSHLDTVPPTDAWTRDPWDGALSEGRIWGLGSNDAKAAVAAMCAAFMEVAARGGPCELGLMLVCEEETGGAGAELAWPTLKSSGWIPDGVVVGEPTGLDVALAQRGLLICELEALGPSCHAANAAVLGVANPIRELVRDLVALESVDLGPPHPLLGPTTMEPTVIRGGDRRNVVPERASVWLDLRTVPGLTHGEIAERLAAATSGGLRIHSERLVPRSCHPDAAVVAAASLARPEARCFGSRTMSDLVFFEGVDAIKCGPGRSERSHTPDEFVTVEELLEGARFYGCLVEAFAAVQEERDREATLG